MPGFELIGKEEQQAVNEIFTSGSLFYNGKRVKQFEEMFARYLGVKYAVAVSSGTAALKTALVAAGVGPDDEVITQSFTFVATVEAIVDVGATPVIVNIDETYNMDPSELEKAITPATKAIIPVDMLGVATEIDQINDIAKANNLLVIDDCCESLGATWGERKLGADYDMAAFSFDNGKTITTGEGGMIATNNLDWYKLCMEYRDHGHENNPERPRGRDTHRIHGFNFRTTELNAAIGIQQLKKLDYIVELNRRNHAILKKALSDINGLKFRKIPEKCKPLCDTLIFNFPTKNVAIEFVDQLIINGFSTKNVPDAIEWHFARYWDHIFKKFGFTGTELMDATKPSADILDRSVALPIVVKMDADTASEKSLLIRSLAKKVLNQ